MMETHPDQNSCTSCCEKARRYDYLKSIVPGVDLEEIVKEYRRSADFWENVRNAEIDRELGID
jgi:hypothetical protein